jgi:hypothetical protein
MVFEQDQKRASFIYRFTLSLFTNFIYFGGLDRRSIQVIMT